VGYGGEAMTLLFLTDHEATLAAQHKLTAIVRVMKKQPMWVSAKGVPHTSGNADKDKIIKPPFLPGTIVPAKETWGCDLELDFDSDGEAFNRIVYKADYIHPELANISQWLSPILMSLSAVRHWYEIKSVRTMQCKDINPDKGQIIVFNRPGIPPDAWCWYAEIEEEK
jgi:hypothetical protein